MESIKHYTWNYNLVFVFINLQFTTIHSIVESLDGDRGVESVILVLDGDIGESKGVSEEHGKCPSKYHVGWAKGALQGEGQRFSAVEHKSFRIDLCKTNKQTRKLIVNCQSLR